MRQGGGMGGTLMSRSSSASAHETSGHTSAPVRFSAQGKATFKGAQLPVLAVSVPFWKRPPPQPQTVPSVRKAWTYRSPMLTPDTPDRPLIGAGLPP